MKKIISFLVTGAILCCGISGVRAAEFSDLQENHWAYTYVSELAESKNINGFEDGTFRPGSKVTRAEFVKMLGKGNERRKRDFDDVSPSHWAYEYVMTSGLDSDSGNLFNPGEYITRGDVAELLWKRAGCIKGISVPPVIHRQSNNYDAVSWVYSNGIMRGNNNINLRLSDTLSRAEAAALIVRMKNISAYEEKTEFVDLLDERIFKITYESFDLIDKPYEENAKLSNGELAMAAAKILCDEVDPTYKNVSATKNFDHKYAQALNMLCRYYLGEENDNPEYMQRNATVKEAVAALVFSVSRSSSSVINPGDAKSNYPLAKDETNAKLKSLLSIAYNNGICFDSPDEMPLNKEITLKEFSALLLEFDGFSGIYTADRLGVSSYYKDMKINSDIDTYPSNFDDYAIILESLPASLYEAPFASAVSLPKESYQFTNDYKSIFETILLKWMSKARGNGVTLGVTYYPGLAVDNGNGYTMRVLAEIESLTGEKKLSDIIRLAENGVEDFELKNGDKFYADIETGVAVNNVNLPVDKMKISAVYR